MDTANRDGQVRPASTNDAGCLSNAREINLAPVNKLIDDRRRPTRVNPEVRCNMSLEGAQLRHHDDRAAGDIHAGAGLHHCQRHSTIAGNPVLPAVGQGYHLFGVAVTLSDSPTGWLAKRFGEAQPFMWSTVAFAAASCLYPAARTC